MCLKKVGQPVVCRSVNTARRSGRPAEAQSWSDLHNIGSEEPRPGPAPPPSASRTEVWSWYCPGPGPGPGLVLARPCPGPSPTLTTTSSIQALATVGPGTAFCLPIILCDATCLLLRCRHSFGGKTCWEGILENLSNEERILPGR